MRNSLVLKKHYCPASPSAKRLMGNARVPAFLFTVQSFMTSSPLTQPSRRILR